MEIYHKLNIKEWALEDRPREKLLYKGISSLTDAELIAILIGSGNAEESAVELSRRILGKVMNNLNELSKLNVEDLKKFKGIGEAKAISIIAAMAPLSSAFDDCAGFGKCRLLLGENDETDLDLKCKRLTLSTQGLILCI